MKKIYSLVLGLFITVSVFAQAPQKMSYQAVIRKSNNALVQSSPVGMKISILKGSATGTAVYVETQTATTNANGLVSLEIGTGSAITGTFAAINWAAGPYFIKTETDPNGGTAYTIAGTNELMSVPYALFSASGNTGPQGPAGATGPQGPIGLTGANGTNGIDGISVTNSNVIGDSLFITLSNGQILNSGYVKGNQGVQGIQGLTGANGTNGTNGIDGISVTNSNVIGDSLFITLSNGQVLNAGYVKGPQGIQGLTGAQGPVGTGSFTHYIGEIFGGGVVFHLWKDAQGVEHGLIVDKTDLSASQVWSNVSILIGTSAQSSWDGLSNSIAIVGQAGHTNSAAALCLNSTNGGQSDWYLPSIQELNMLWNSYYTVARSLSQISGATQMKTAGYWSSSEANGSYGWGFAFNGGYIFNGSKYDPIYVRAVRAF
jgi:hypothetical protein